MTMSVLFVMNWPDDTGLMLKRAHETYELVAKNLSVKGIKSFISYPKVTKEYVNSSLNVVEIDAHFGDGSNNEEFEAFLIKNNVKLVVYIDKGFLWNKVNFFRRINITLVEYCRYSQNYDAIKKNIVKNLIKKLMFKCRIMTFDKYIVISESAKHSITTIIGVPSERIVKINNGIDLSKIENTPAIKEDCDKSIILSVFQLRPQKNILFIIDVIKALSKQRTDFHYVHVGGGQQLDLALKKVKDYGIEEFCSFVGEKNDAVPYMKNAQLLIHACKEEAHGNVITEAMTCEVPVIAVKSPGALEQISASTGTLIHDLDVDSFCQNINHYLDSPELRLRTGQLASERARKCFNMQAQANHLIDLIDELISDEHVGKTVTS